MPKRRASEGASAAKRPRRRRQVNDSYKHPVSCGSVRKVQTSTGIKIKPDPEHVERARMKNGGVPGEGPYPSRERPTPGDAYRAVDELASLHGEYEHGESGTVLDSLVRTMLSQNTTDVTSAVSENHASHRPLSSLRRHPFPPPPFQPFAVLDRLSDPSPPHRPNESISAHLRSLSKNSRSGSRPNAALLARSPSRSSAAGWPTSGRTELWASCARCGGSATRSAWSM